MDKKLLEKANEMLEVQGNSGNWDCDSYMHGMYNGMEYMLALIEEREPKFRTAPKKWKFTGANWGSVVYKIVNEILYLILRLKNKLGLNGDKSGSIK